MQDGAMHHNYSLHCEKEIVTPQRATLCYIVNHLDNKNRS